MAFALFIYFLLMVQSPLCQATAPPGHTQAGTSSGCSKWHTVKQGDTCPSIEKQYGISHKDFLQWNTAVSGDCSQNFWLTYAYCVGVQPAKTASAGGSLPISTLATHTFDFNSLNQATASLGKYPAGNSTSSGMDATGTGYSAKYSIRNPIKIWSISSSTIDMSWPPKQTQAGLSSQCNKWYLVNADESCEDISVRNSVSKADL